MQMGSQVRQNVFKRFFPWLLAILSFLAMCYLCFVVVDQAVTIHYGSIGFDDVEKERDLLKDLMIYNKHLMTEEDFTNYLKSKQIECTTFHDRPNQYYVGSMSFKFENGVLSEMHFSLD